mgnify:CR=1 FL=1
MGEKEAFYDERIAPELLRLAELAQEAGIGFVAMVEWEPGEGGRTVALPKGASVGIRMVEVAMRARGNVDALFIAISKYARQHGHSSLYLHRLGIPHQPGTEEREGVQ